MQTPEVAGEQNSERNAALKNTVYFMCAKNAFIRIVPV